MGGRRFKIITGIVCDTHLPDSPRNNDAGNAVEFIEVTTEREMGEGVEVEVPPKLIQNPKNKEQKYYNDWASMCGSNLRSKVLMYGMLERGEIVLE